jgi:hypothetical protein
VEKVELTPASKYAGADPSTSTVAWAFREDRAAYTQTRQGPLVLHTLTMEIAATTAARGAVDVLTGVADSQGVVARVTLASGEVLVAGHSNRFGVQYPMRLTRVETISGHSPNDVPTIFLTFECAY